MVEVAFRDNPNDLLKPITQFEDGSAAFACSGFDHDGYVWVTNGHFCLRAGPTASLPQKNKIRRPDKFPAMLDALPARSFVPAVLFEGRVTVGEAILNETYFNACCAGRDEKRLTWRSSGQSDPVYGLDAGEVFCLIMPIGPKERT